MILTLQVVGEQAQGLGSAGRKVFNAIGGTIGRLPDNDWVFSDPYVSGRHALIRYLNGKYFIEDTSTNGVFINSPQNRLARSTPQQLKDGDLLYIDAYEIQVSIESDASEDLDDPFTVLQARARGSASQRTGSSDNVRDDRTANLRASDDDDEGDEEGTEWFGTSEPAEVSQPQAQLKRAEPKQPEPRAAEPRHGMRARAEASQSSSSFAQSSERRVAPPASRPATTQGPAHRARSGANADGAQLHALLEAAGIEGLDATSDAAHTLGDMLRVCVGGVMEVLRARERMKDELRMRGTTFKAAHNNPLKFSANIDDAFHNLLVKHNPAYLEPAEAFEDAFRDVRDHQSAFLAAMRIAFESMLAQFDPNRLQEEFDRQMKKGSILGVPAKLRYWDLYRDKYGALAGNAESAFRQLFSDEFAKAYEEQLERLKALSRGRDK